MDYEQKYKDALERAKAMIKVTANQDEAIGFVNTIFPELKESEDERMIKSLKRLIKAYYDVNFPTPEGFEREDMLAWLEKQGKQKPTTIDIDKMVDDYANNKERGNEEFGKPVYCMIRAYRQGLKDAIGKVVLKPTWNEEDEVRLQACIDTLQAKSIMGKVDTINTNWLKSLKQRIGG